MYCMHFTSLHTFVYCAMLYNHLVKSFGVIYWVHSLQNSPYSVHCCIFCDTKFLCIPLADFTSSHNWTDNWSFSEIISHILLLIAFSVFLILPSPDILPNYSVNIIPTLSVVCWKAKANSYMGNSVSFDFGWSQHSFYLKWYILSEIQVHSYPEWYLLSFALGILNSLSLNHLLFLWSNGCLQIMANMYGSCLHDFSGEFFCLVLYNCCLLVL